MANLEIQKLFSSSLHISSLWMEAVKTQSNAEQCMIGWLKKGHLEIAPVLCHFQLWKKAIVGAGKGGGG